MLDKGQQEDWLDSWWIVTLAALTVTGFVAFVMHEWTTRDAIVDLRVLRDRTFAAGVVLITVVGAVLYATIALLPLFLQTLLGYPALQSGYATSPRGLGAIVGMLVAGRLVGRVDTRWLIATGFGLLALSVHMLGNITLDVTIASVAWPQVLSGLALGFIFVPLSTTSLGTLPKEEIGNATGIYNLMRNVGGSIGISMMTTLLAPRPGPPGDPGPARVALRRGGGPASARAVGLLRAARGAAGGRERGAGGALRHGRAPGNAARVRGQLPADGGARALLRADRLAPAPCQPIRGGVGRRALVKMGGPEMAPHTPQRSERPGEPVALLDQARITPVRRGRRRPCIRGSSTRGRRRSW